MYHYFVKVMVCMQSFSRIHMYSRTNIIHKKGIFGQANIIPTWLIVHQWFSFSYLCFVIHKTILYYFIIVICYLYCMYVQHLRSRISWYNVKKIKYLAIAHFNWWHSTFAYRVSSITATIDQPTTFLFHIFYIWSVNFYCIFRCRPIWTSIWLVCRM